MSKRSEFKVVTVSIVSYAGDAKSDLNNMLQSTDGLGVYVIGGDFRDLTADEYEELCAQAPSVEYEEE